MAAPRCCCTRARFGLVERQLRYLPRVFLRREMTARMATSGGAMLPFTAGTGSRGGGSASVRCCVLWSLLIGLGA